MKRKPIGVRVSLMSKSKGVVFLFLAGILLGFFYLQFADASFQSPDKLIYQGQTYDLNTPLPNKRLPLDFSDDKNRFFSLPRSKIMISSGCSRGYVASWVVEENVLFLQSVKRCPENKNIPLKDMFPNFNNPSKIKADWFSGTLILENKQERLSLEIKGGAVLSEGRP